MDDPPDHFFKFIPPGFKFRLSIPKSYLRKLDGWRCKKATLRRGHHKWFVHIGDGGIFGHGWRKFVADNGVQELDFIVFKHQGNMVFEFFVFDQSTCERQYPNLPDDKVEVSLKEFDSLYTQERSKMLNKRKRADYVSQSKDELRVDDDRCFVAIMTPYHIRTSRLNVPMKFARSNGLTTKGMHTQIVLVDEAKRTWPAKLHIKTDQIRLSGWRKLIIKNNVKVGDACVFKLVKAGKVPVFKFYRKKHTKNYIQVKETSSSSTIRKATNSSLGNHPYFNLTMKPSYRSPGLYLPLEFSKSNGLEVGEMILRDDEGRSWKIQVNKKRGEKYLYFSRGFKAFWDANGLKVGEDYRFVLLEKEKAKPPIMIVSYLGNKAVKKEIQVKETSWTTGSGLGNHPYFISTIKPSFRKSGLFLPVEFSISNGLQVGKMILQNNKGRSWKVQLNKSGKNQFYLGCGFRDFWIANGLTEGDAYKFELVVNEKDKTPVVNFSYLGKKPTNNHMQVKKETSSTLQRSTCYFISTMKPYSVKRSRLYIPREFSISHDLRVGEMILRDDNGKSWKVRLNKTGTDQFYLTCGFRDFRVANGLTEGVAYKFELVENDKDKPPIVNFSLNVDSLPSGKEDHPNYISKVKSYSMYLPSAFVMTNGLLNKEEMILKNDDERSWTMDIKRDRNYCYVGRRWKEFCVANDLKEGDLIKLEMVGNGEIPVAKFHVQKIH